MPLRRGKKNIGSNIREFRQGRTYARTRRKFGAKRAQQQAIAVALRASRKRGRG